MQTELVKVQTSDQLRLDGALFTPDSQTEQKNSVNALICLHGAGSNFYGSSTLDEITEPLVQQGISVLRVNTRGHDWVYPALVRFQVTRQGSSYEDVAKCTIDIRSWIDFLIERGYQKIGLLGHSLGAIKAVYTMAQQHIEQVANIVAISPPRLSYSYFRESPDGPQFFADYQHAKKLSESGQGSNLIEVKHPLPFLVCAKGFVDKYGPEEKYNILKFADKVQCPTLYIYGEMELKGGTTFVGMPESLTAVANERSGNKPTIMTHIVEGANHLYTGKTSELAAKLCDWFADSED